MQHAVVYKYLQQKINFTKSTNKHKSIPNLKLPKNQTGFNINYYYNNPTFI